MRSESDLLLESLDLVKAGLVQRGLWPPDGRPRPDRPDAVVDATKLLEIARTVYMKAATRPRAEGAAEEGRGASRGT